MTHVYDNLNSQNFNGGERYRRVPDTDLRADAVHEAINAAIKNIEFDVPGENVVGVGRVQIVFFENAVGVIERRA